MILPPSIKIAQILEVLDDLVGDGYLNEWEKEFVLSNRSRASEDFTESQINIVEKLYAKACESPY